MSENDELYFTFDLGENNSIDADFDLEKNNSIDANFNIYATGAVWGGITGDIVNQTDLKNALDTLSGQIDSDHQAITEINTTIESYGDVVTYNASDFATSAQGALADTALQPNDNISALVNNVGYITSADLPTLQDLTTQAQLDAINSGATSTNIGQIAANTQAISTETTNRQNADNALQSQIDALVVSSDVFDVVGTYAELQAYDISTVPVNDIIKVLVDSTHNNAATYYRCVENNNVKSWSYIGAEGAYYTKSESDSLFVPQTRTINNYALSNNITLTASDVGAVAPSDLATVATTGDYDDLTNKPTIPTVGNGTITFTQGGVNKGSITVNQSGNTTIALDAGGGTVDQTFDSTSANAQSGVAIYGALTDGSITPKFLGEIQFYDDMTPAYIQFANGATEFSFSHSINVGGSVSAADVYIGSSAIQATGQNYDELTIANDTTSDSIVLGSNSINVDTSISGNAFTYNGNEVATTNNIPTVNDATITFTQGGVTKGTITLNQSSNQTIALDAGGGTVDQTFDGTSTNAQSGVAIQNELDENYLIKGNNIFQSGASCEISESTLDYYNSYSDNLLRVEYDNVALSGYDYNGSVINHSHTLLVSGTGIRFANENYYTNITIPSSGSLAIDGHNIITDNNLKTINNQSIVGSGNINISGGTTYTAGNGINITNDTISIDSSVVATQTDISDMATQTWVGNQGYLTSSALTNYVTTDTAQDISGRKTFLGEKAIYFKQQATSNKLGFTLYNPSGGELAALEYRPNTINGASLLALNCPQTTGGYVGFRYWGTPAVNIVAPKVATAGNYFMATHITNGNTTVAASSAGAVDISTLLPDISTKQDTLVSGTNIKTINNTSLLGSGNLSISADNIFWATYGTTTYADMLSAINDGKLVLCTYNGSTYYYDGSGGGFIAFTTNTLRTNYVITVDSSNNWTNDSRAFPTKTSDLTNDSGYITTSALSGYATETYVDTGLATKQNTISDLSTIRSNANSAIQPATLNSAMKNKEDVFDQIKSPLAITYTNGLVDFNGSDCYITSDGILTGDTEWCIADVTSDSVNIATDYWEWRGSFKYSGISTDTQLLSVDDDNSQGFILDINSSGEVFSEDDTSNILATVSANTWTSFKLVHQANSNTVEVTLLNSQGVLETHSTPLVLTGSIIAYNWRVDTGCGIEFNLASPVSYYMLMPNGEHHTFLNRNLEMPLWYDSTTSTLNIGILQ